MAVRDQFTPLRPSELWAALTIFLIPTIVALLVTLVGADTMNNLPEWLEIVLVIFFLGSLIAAFGFAIIRGLPRWSPPYLGVVLVGFVWFGPFWRLWGLIYPSVVRWFGTMYTWSMPVRIFVQGMQAALTWFLVLLAALILISVLRLLPHTRTLWQRIRRDWTQLSFLLYGGVVVHITLILDEYQHDEPWMLAAWVSLAAGSWLYLRAREKYQRILILLAGATVAMWIVAVGKWYLVPLQNWTGWFERYAPETERWFEAGRTIADWFCLVVALLLPALLSLLRRTQGVTLQEDPVAP